MTESWPHSFIKRRWEQVHPEESFLKNENNDAYLCNLQIQSWPGAGGGVKLYTWWSFHKTLHDIKLKLRNTHENIYCTQATNLRSIYISYASGKRKSLFTYVSVSLADILYICCKRIFIMFQHPPPFIVLPPRFSPFYANYEKIIIKNQLAGYSTHIQAGIRRRLYKLTNVHRHASVWANRVARGNTQLNYMGARRRCRPPPPPRLRER